jgi:hypothetical protein
MGFQWDSASPLLFKEGCSGVARELAANERWDLGRSQLYTLVNGTTVRRPVRSNDAHMMRVLPSMRGTSDDSDDGDRCHTISLRFTNEADYDSCMLRGQKDGPRAECGLANVVAACETSDYRRCQGLTNRFASVPLHMWVPHTTGRASAFACGGRFESDIRVKSDINVQCGWGSILTMRWFPAAGTLRYFVDGKHHPRSDVVGIPSDLPLQWAVDAPYQGTRIEIVDGRLGSSL